MTHKQKTDAYRFRSIRDFGIEPAIRCATHGRPFFRKPPLVSVFQKPSFLEGIRYPVCGTKRAFVAVILVCNTHSKLASMVRELGGEISMKLVEFCR